MLNRQSIAYESKPTHKEEEREQIWIKSNAKSDKEKAWKKKQENSGENERAMR